MGPVQSPRFLAVTDYGKYGVDLFFVLSGWLIGGLYWREAVAFGEVEVGRFILRRWLRTIPPYAAALTLAWTAAHLQRGQPFDFGYLAFLQNYYQPQVPFFVASWSLCVEEHFYLLMPLSLALVRSRRIALNCFLLSLLLFSFTARWQASAEGFKLDFNYYTTATHMRWDGLILGFWAAMVPWKYPAMWNRVLGWRRRLAGSGLALLALLPFLEDRWLYRVGILAMATGFLLLIVSMVGCELPRRIRGRWIRSVALASYSVYLTHALVIHGAVRISHLFHGSEWVFYPVAVAMVAGGGGAFYVMIERSAIELRDTLVPIRRIV